jgi:hypothetical protein
VPITFLFVAVFFLQIIVQKDNDDNTIYFSILDEYEYLEVPFRNTLTKNSFNIWFRLCCMGFMLAP